jgi:hypothetical protein
MGWNVAQVSFSAFGIERSQVGAGEGHRTLVMGVLINAAEAVEVPDRISVERGTFTAAGVKMLVDAAKGEWKTLTTCGYSPSPAASSSPPRCPSPTGWERDQG